MKYKFINYFLLLIIIFAGFSIQSCDDTISIQDVDNKIIPEANVSFGQHIYPVFQVKCFSCHGNGIAQGGLDLTLWTNIVDGRVVVPGDTLTSLLIWTVDRPPRAGFPQMPPNFSPQLTPNQIKGIKTWVAEGALNN